MKVKVEVEWVMGTSCHRSQGKRSESIRLDKMATKICLYQGIKELGIVRWIFNIIIIV